MTQLAHRLIQSSLLEAQNLLTQFIQNSQTVETMVEVAQRIQSLFEKRGRVFVCGNGGSMCDAMHFAEELSGRFRNERKALAALSISDPTHISCVANDYGYEHVFSRYIEALGRQGDVLLGISTSGNSNNVINAVRAANEKEMKTVALTGKTGGIISNIADIEIRAPFSEFADRAQEIHIKVIHALIDGIEKELKVS